MSDRGTRSHGVVVLAALAVLTLCGARAGHATQKWGPIQFSGNLQSQNLIRTPDAGEFQFVQNRNVARLQLEYNWLQAGKFYNRYDIPFLENSTLVLKYRGVYDSVYDLTPGFLQKYDIHGRAFGENHIFDIAREFEDAAVYAPAAANRRAGMKGFARRVLSLEGLSGTRRDALKFENQLREFFADVKLRTIPLQVRIGRQQIVWGETDNFRMLDRANSLDLTWHFQQEIPAPALGWDEIRRPFWMIKFLYDLGDVWKLSQNFVEWYWNPGDWYPVKQSFLPQPWGLPMMDPLRNPIDGVFIGGVCQNSRIRGYSAAQNQMAGVCTQLLNGTTLFKRGDWERTPFDNSQVGVRYHGIMPFGFEFTLNYFYQRWAGDDGTNSAMLRGLPKNPENNAKAVDLIANGVFPAEAYHPYVHTVGLSGNYSDEEFTQAVFRLETVYDFGIPFFDVSKATVIDNPALPGITKKNMWKGMIAFDRPTWIRSLNKKSTFFLTGQFFWHYMPNNPECEFDPKTTAQKAAAGEKVGSCLVGALDLPSSARTDLVFRDKIRDWETLFTLAGFTFYRGGSLVPVVGIAVDPTNQWNMEPFWDLDYVVRDDLVLNIGQRYFVTPRGRHEPVFETWGLAGLNAGRSETSIRLTFQF